MKTAKQITEEHESILQFDDKEQAVIIQCMKAYAEQAIEQCALSATTVRYPNTSIISGVEKQSILNVKNKLT